MLTPRVARAARSKRCRALSRCRIVKYIKSLIHLFLYLFVQPLQRRILCELIRNNVIISTQVDTTNCGPVIAYQALSSATYFEVRLFYRD